MSQVLTYSETAPQQSKLTFLTVFDNCCCHNGKAHFSSDIFSMQHETIIKQMPRFVKKQKKVNKYTSKELSISDGLRTFES